MAIRSFPSSPPFPNASRSWPKAAGEVNVLSNWQADGNGGLGLLWMVN